LGGGDRWREGDHGDWEDKEREREARSGWMDACVGRREGEGGATDILVSVSPCLWLWISVSLLEAEENVEVKMLKEEDWEVGRIERQRWQA